MDEDRRRGLVTQGAAYFSATLVALGVGLVLGGHEPWLRLGAADVAATVVVFAFSVRLSNSSLYDPYWSVAPPLLGMGWLALEGDAVTVRQALAFALIFLWGARLTYSFFRGWPGLSHEDWRYRDLREKTGRAYWLVSFLGIHFFPTVLTFGGTVAYFAAAGGPAELSAIDGAAAATTALGIWLETTADRQLRDYVQDGPDAGAILVTGLWAHCRHPNYLGELLFWWGIGLFAVAAGAPLVYALGGAAAITLLFVFISIPMIERRMSVRRPGWAEHAQRVPVLIPWRVGPLSRRRPGANG
ncbi:MAG: hypothetical protein DRJ42_25320 [Deltaproteobacteria bacterium]|nr:MAG: hypothetical protein DRJ42_25320 [Deltaproteobacteria bacterium]